ncbi:MAG: hypothetical protein MJ104_09260 [Lachnospiraceae bacterium]|nr:hypothetical protein [Lachnospiraceae bacterium]
MKFAFEFSNLKKGLVKKGLALLCTAAVAAGVFGSPVASLTAKASQTGNAGSSYVPSQTGNAGSSYVPSQTGNAGSSYVPSQTGNAGSSTSTTTQSAASSDMSVANVSGVTLGSWDDVAKNVSLMSLLKLKEANANANVSADVADILHLNISSAANKTVPVSAVADIKSSEIGGIHAFLGNGDAVSFLKKYDYTKYTGVDFSHQVSTTDNSKTITFNKQVSINGTVVFHTLVPANKFVSIYEVINGQEVLIAKTVSSDAGRVCFNITETAVYVLRY